jgi:hypothetical protein
MDMLCWVGHRLLCSWSVLFGWYGLSSRLLRVVIGATAVVIAMRSKTDVTC